MFTSAFDRFNSPAHVFVLLGRCYSSAQMLEATAALTFIEQSATFPMNGSAGAVVKEMRKAVRNTHLLDALNQGRKWARTRLAQRLSAMLENDIVVAVVPSHDPWITETPIRLLAQEIAAASEGRADATSCLVRHTKIARIVYGGPSNAALHRQTIRVENPHLIAGRRVLLLDDILHSGHSLVTCRTLLYEAEASVVQAAALGRIVGGEV